MNKKESPHNESSQLSGKYSKLAANQKKTEIQLRDLQEHMKELDCFYKISDVVNKPETTLDEIIQGIADIIPVSGPKPEYTSANIKIFDQEFHSDNLLITEKFQRIEVYVNGKAVGSISVYIDESNGTLDFLPEEHRLLSAIAERLGKIIERYKARETLLSYQTSLKPQNLSDEEYPDFLDARNQFEYNYLQQLLTDAKHNKSNASKYSGLSRSYLYKLLKKHGLL